MIYGYGILLSDKPLTTKRRTTTKAYLTLRKKLITNITIEAIPDLSSEREQLYSMIESLKPKDVLVFASFEAIANNGKDAAYLLREIISKEADWAIIGFPEYSSYNIDTFRSLNLPISQLNYISDSLYYVNFDRTTGRKAIQISELFIEVFFDWQNYFITTEEACDILGMKVGTFYNKASDFIREPKYRQKYCSLYNTKMVDWRKKPMRGPKFKTPQYNEFVIHFIGGCGPYEKWTVEDIEEMILYEAEAHVNVIDLIPQDAMRLYLNFMIPAATTKAAKEFYNPEVLKKYK